MAGAATTVPGGAKAWRIACCERAAAASGAVLWFLHADSAVPEDALGAIEEALQDARVAGGCLRLRFPRTDWIYRVSDSLGNAAVDAFGITLGDHGFFCRRVAFVHAGGFPDVPLMEDAEFYQALRQVGRTRQLACEIVTSPRRYEELGLYRTTAMYVLILALYCARAPLPWLAKLHSRFLASARTPRAATLLTSLYEESVRA